MKVSDILRVKGGTLYVVKPDDSLTQAMATMAEKDMGSLVVVEGGAVVGMLTFREVIKDVVKHNGQVAQVTVRDAMEKQPLLCTVDTEMGVVSFYDVAKAVVEEQSFENQLLKAYIRDWPQAENATDNAAG